VIILLRLVLLVIYIRSLVVMPACQRASDPYIPEDYQLICEHIRVMFQRELTDFISECGHNREAV